MAPEGSVLSPMPTTEMNEEWVSKYGVQLVFMSTVPMVLNTTIQLKVFDILSEAGPGAQLSASEIVSRMPDGGSKNPDGPFMLDRMLRLLVGYSVLNCSLDDAGETARYGLTPVGRYFASSEDRASLAPLLTWFQDKNYISSWSELTNAVVEGGVPFERVHGVNVFEYTGRDPVYNELFNQAMTAPSTQFAKQIVEQYKGFEHINQLVDVGGGHGVTLHMIISKYPNIKGINYDLPHVIEHAPPYPGMEHVGGDMFQSIPRGDAIIIKWILHDWSDSQCLKLLKNCFEALPEGGKVIVVDAIRPVKPDHTPSSIAISGLDLILLTQFPGGKERSEKDFLALATRAGFKGINITSCSVAIFSVMEFYK